MPSAWASTSRMSATSSIIICPRTLRATTRRRAVPDGTACPPAVSCCTAAGMCGRPSFSSSTARAGRSWTLKRRSACGSGTCCGCGRWWATAGPAAACGSTFCSISARRPRTPATPAGTASTTLRRWTSAGRPVPSSAASWRRASTSACPSSRRHSAARNRTRYGSTTWTKRPPTASCGT